MFAWPWMNRQMKIIQFPMAGLPHAMTCTAKLVVFRMYVVLNKIHSGLFHVSSLEITSLKTVTVLATLSRFTDSYYIY